MKLVTWIVPGLVLVSWACAGLAAGDSPSIAVLEADLARRLAAINAAGDLVRAGRKRRNALAKCLGKTGKTGSDLESNAKIVEAVVKKLARCFRDDEEMLIAAGA